MKTKQKRRRSKARINPDKDVKALRFRIQGLYNQVTQLNQSIQSQAGVIRGQTAQIEDLLKVRDVLLTTMQWHAKKGVTVR